jgi:peptide/nickel transport system substrate-binding protein
MSSSNYQTHQAESLIERYRTARISRRELLRNAQLAGTLGLAAVLVACGVPSVPSSSAATTAPAQVAGTPSAANKTGTGGAAPTTAAAAAAGTPRTGGELHAAQTNENATLDPLTSGFVSERQAYYNMYDSLVAIDKDLKIIPWLAEAWETPDPTTYMFRLRKDVKFHDGTEFNADAVKFNLDRYQNDEKSARKGEINFIKTTEVVDPSTVKVTMKAPFAPFLANLVDRAGMMLSPTAVKAGGADFSRKPVGAGTGAFKFVEWVNNDHLTLERNPNYWLKDANGKSLPYLDRVIYRPITDQTVLLTNITTGNIDATYAIAPKDVSAVKSNPDVVLQSTPGLSFDAFEFNTQAPPFDKKELRQAVAELLDREQIRTTIFFGTTQVGYGPIPPSSWAFDPNFKPYTGGVDKAKQYLQAAGQPNGFEFEYKLAGGNPVGLQLLQLVKDQLARAGITLNITQLDAPTIQSQVRAGNFQATAYNWSGRIDPDGNIYNQLHTGGGLADTKYSNPQVDELLDQTRSASNQEQRKTVFQQAQKLFVDDAPMAWYTFEPAYLLMRPNLQGMQIYADYIMRFHAAWLKA